MKAILALILIVLGGWLIYSGWQRRESLAGKTEAKLAELGRKLDGESHAPDYFWQLAGGGVLFIGGALMLVSKRKD